MTTLAYGSPDKVSTVTRAAGSAAAASTTYAYYPVGATQCPDSTTQACTVVTDANGHPSTFYYDPVGRVTMSVDANGNPRSTTYDPSSNVTSLVDAMSSANTSTFTYDALNNLTQATSPAPSPGASGTGVTYAYGDPSSAYVPTSSTDAQGNTTNYTYDSAGNLVSTTDATGNTTTRGIQGSTASCAAKPGEVCATTDANANTTSFGYDASGNLTSVTPPSPLGASTATYDALGRVTSVTDGKALTTTYTYNAANQVTRAAYGDGTSVTYTYNADGNLLSETGANGTTTYTYDALGRVTSETTGAASTSSVTYDGVGNVTSYTDAGGTVSYGYDPANNLVSVAEPGGNCSSVPSGCTTFGYNNDNQLVNSLYPNGMTQSYYYDNAGRQVGQLASLASGATVFRPAYSYTTPAGANSSLLASATNDLSGVVTSYSYDALNRLTNASLSGGASYVYGYDPNGNITSSSANGGLSATTHTYNAANQLSDPGAAYDANGNTTSLPGGSVSLGYNAKNQTVLAQPAGAAAYSLAYQGVGQARLTQDSSTTLVNDLLGSAGTVTEGATTAYFTRTPSGQLISMRINGQSYYYVTDYQGSVVALTDTAGAEVTAYSFDPYGNLTAASGSVGQPFGYAGGYFDNSSGLYHFGARYYDPSLGRWTQLDPSGQSAGYVYAGDDPVNLIDPGGLGLIDFFTNTVPHFFTHTIPNAFNRFAIKHGARASFQSGLTQYLGAYGKLAYQIYKACGFACLAAFGAASLS